MKLWSWFDLHKSPSGVLSSSSYLNLTELSELQKCMVYSCFTCMCWPSETNQCYPPPPLSLLSCTVIDSVFSLLWPSPRISPKLWVPGCCPTLWRLRQQWPPQRPQTHWLSARLLPHTIHLITFCKARLSATQSWDLPRGPSAPPTGQSSSLLTDT